MPEIPLTMRYVEITKPGDPDVLAIANVPVSQPGPDEVLIRVKAAGLNHADLMQRRGNYPPPPGASPILGLEVSGHIAAVGSNGSGRWNVGDPVCALVAGGGYAEYCVAPAGQCMPVPQGVSLIEAAALPEAVLTVWANLFEPRRLVTGDLFLVQGGSSGIGSIAIQIARCFGARVSTTAGSEEKCRFALDLGAEQAINYRTDDWAAKLAEWSKPHGIDVILDMIGGDYFPKHVALLAQRGRLVHIAYLRGSPVSLDLRAVMNKRLLITGSTLRPRSVQEKSSLVSSAVPHVWPLFEAGRIRSKVSKVFPLSQAAEAHRSLEASEQLGKLVLEVPEA